MRNKNKKNRNNKKGNNRNSNLDKNIVNYKKKNINKNENFINNIKILPKEIQKKIYIMCFRNFWRSYVPLTAQIPTWYDRKIKIEKQIFESRRQNIHFMHLPFNTLESNKKYIMGCQCNFCKTIFNNIDINDNYKKIIDDPYYFKSIMPKSGEGINNYYHVYGETLVKNYDPYCGTMYEDLVSYSLRTGHVLKFGYSGLLTDDY